MTPEEARTKALAVLRDGRLRLLTVRTDPAGHLLFADAIVYGHRSEHFVTFALQRGRGTWQCSCKDDPPCSHVFAAELVCHGVMPPGRDGHPKARPERKPRPAASYCRACADKLPEEDPAHSRRPGCGWANRAVEATL